MNAPETPPRARTTHLPRRLTGTLFGFVALNDSPASLRLVTWCAVGCSLAGWLLVVAFPSVAVLSLAGCRSGAESDLVARELRMQEDQLYAMEDYLTQYQQLLRKYRAENAALKCRLDESGEELPQPASGDRRRTSPRRPAPTTAPTLEPPTRPESDEMPAASPEQNIELPDVPPLEETTEHAPNLYEDESLSQSQNALVALAGFDEENVPELEVTDRDDVAALQGGGIEDETSIEQHEASIEVSDSTELGGVLTQVLVRCEIVESDAGGGPRFVVDVAPLSARGSLVPFTGNVSLMILAAGNDSKRRNLARWDFTPEEVQAATDEAEGAMRFYIELPADVPVESPVQLWARLLPREGEKQLVYVDIDLRRPGPFSSLIDDAAPRDVEAQGNQQIAVEQAQIERQVQHVSQSDNNGKAEPIAQTHRTEPVDVADGTWSIARPDEPQKVAQGNEQTGGTWRTASEPLPEVIPVSKPPRGSETRSELAYHRLKQSAARDRARAEARRFEVPTWTPDRTAKSGNSVEPQSSRTATRPKWSPDR